MDNINVFNIALEIDDNFIKANSDKILTNYIYINKYLLLKYTRDLWFNRHFYTEDYKTKMQMLIPISNLIAYFNKTTDDRYIERAVMILYYWYEENYKTHYYKKQNATIIATRLLVACDLYVVVKRLGLCVVDEVFENILLSHCGLLESPKNYQVQCSEGLEQDIALYVAAIVLYELYNNANFLTLRALVKERLINQLNYLILNDGTFIEHSLERAYYVYIRLIDFYSFVVNCGESEDLSTFIKGKMDSLLIFIYAMLEPGGYLPNFGESSYLKINLDKLFQFNNSLNEHIRYVYTGGLKGKKLLYKNVYFPNYCFINVNKTEIDANFMRFVFYYVYNVNYKHYDNLAFTLYYKNLPILVDSGYYPNKESMYFENIISLSGHNAIRVDNHDYLLEKSFVNKTGITNITIDNHITLLSSVSLLYEGILLRRSFLIIKDEYLLLIDEFDSNSNHLYEISFNLNPKLTLNKNETEYFASMNDMQYLAIKNLFCTEDYTAVSYYGDKIACRGFYTANSGELEPINQIIYRIKGSRVLNLTLLTLNPSSSFTYQVLNKQIKFKIGENEYTLLRNKYYRFLEQNGQLINDEKTHNKVLLTGINKFYQNMKK